MFKMPLMKSRLIKNSVIVLFMMFIAGASYAQGTNARLNLTFPANAKMSPKFKAAVEKQKKEFQKLMGWNTEIKSYTPAFMLDKIDNSPEYNHLYIAEYWIAFNYEVMIPELIKRVSNTTEVGLVESADLVIPERVMAGQMQFYENGPVSDDDIFTVAGRANRLLTLITGENFGTVSMNASPMQLKALQDRWVEWFKTL